MVAGAFLAPARGKTGKPPWRIGLTPVFLDDQIAFLAQWRRWLAARLDRPVSFLQRGNYREIIDLLLAGRIDFAWVCGYPYVRHRRQLELVAAPLWQGQPLYRSYIIVPRASRAQRLAELRGKAFAYSDPDSNSGFLYPNYALHRLGENASSFFSRTFFTWAHRSVVEAVGVELAGGGAVDGYVWEMLARNRPALTAATRVIEQSPWFGFPPFVARPNMPVGELSLFRQALIDMANDSRGVELLGALGLDGFVFVVPSLYDGIARMIERMKR